METATTPLAKARFLTTSAPLATQRSAMSRSRTTIQMGPRSAYPISVANIKKAERNIFRGNQSDLKEFWQRRAWEPSGGKSRRESERTVAAD
jgi:hypothetical protein